MEKHRGFPGRLAGTDFHGAEHLAAAGIHRGSVVGFDDEIQPLEAAVTAENQFLAGVIGHRDDGDDGFSGKVLVLGDLQGCGKLRLRGSGAKQRCGEKFQVAADHRAGGLAQPCRGVNLTRGVSTPLTAESAEKIPISGLGGLSGIA